MNLQYPDLHNNIDDVALGFDSIADYLGDQKEHLFGSTLGRVASRITNATFAIDDTTYNLTKNNGNHHYDGLCIDVRLHIMLLSRFINIP